MEEHSKILSSLEHLIEEFYDPSIGRTKKDAIEKELNNFRNQIDCWKWCVHFINHSTNSYVLMFTFTTIETVIKRNWHNLGWEQRAEIKSALYAALIEQSSSVRHFVRFKLSKLLCDIARHDWPHAYPDFYGSVLQLLHGERRRQHVGLILLRTVSEEFTNTANTTNAKRRDELMQLLHRHVPQTLQILTSILERLCSRNDDDRGVTATPPPSPSDPAVEHRYYAATRAKPNVSTLSGELLVMLQQLFTWIRLDDVPLALVKGLFHYVGIAVSSHDDDLSVVTLSTINELMYRKCVPSNAQNLYVEMYRNTIETLRAVVCPLNNAAYRFDRTFVDKLCELLSLLVEQHLWRLEAEPDFSAMEFLSLLYQYTNQQSRCDCYLSCLNVWSAFMKQLKPSNGTKYAEALHGLTATVINKLQFAYNRSMLETLNRRASDDNDEDTEWNDCLNRSVAVLSNARNFSPVETFNQVYVGWKALNDVYLTLGQAVNVTNGTLNLDVQMIERLHCVLNDLTSLTHALARLSSTMNRDDDPNKALDAIIEEFVSRLLHTASYTAKANFYKLHSNLKEHFIDLHAEILASVKTSYAWLPQGNLNASDLISLTTPVLLSDTNEPGKLSHSAAHLFVAITTTASPLSLMTMHPIVQLIHNIHLISYPNSETGMLMYNGLSNILVRECEALNVNERMQRDVLTTTLFDNLTKNFRDLHHDDNKDVVKMVCSKTLPVLNNIVIFFYNHNTNSKKRLYQQIEETLYQVVEVYPNLIEHHDLEESALMLDLLANLMCSLQQQLGVETIINAVQIFLQTSMSTQHFLHDMSTVDKMLHLLQLAIEAPGLPIANLIPNILELCIKNICPIAFHQNNHNMDCPIALLGLLHSLLLYRWQYFYVSQVRMGNSPGCSDIEAAPDCLQQPVQFLSILQIFGQALLQSDLNIFRTSLMYLEDLNTKWKLYFKVLFREQLLEQFLTVLLQTLLNKSQGLLTDEITVAVYNMASVNFPAFFGVFFPKFLATVEGLPVPQKTTIQQSFLEVTDQPTFVANLNRTVSDMCYFLVCNNC